MRQDELSKLKVKGDSMKKLLVSLYLIPCILQAQQIDFGKIANSKEGFKQYWGLDDTEMKRYENYMEIAGKYRHQHLDPLHVLSMIAPSKEDREYYAQKAAAYEHQMSKREIESAWLISTAMEGQMAADMQTFTDELIGINTQNVQNTALTDWAEGDELVLLLDSRCFTSACVAQFLPQLAKVPAVVSKKTVVLMDKITPVAGQLSELEKQAQIKRYDPIEHKGFEQVSINRIYALRAGKLQGVRL